MPSALLKLAAGWLTTTLGCAAQLHKAASWKEIIVALTGNVDMERAWTQKKIQNSQQLGDTRLCSTVVSIAKMHSATFATHSNRRTPFQNGLCKGHFLEVESNTLLIVPS